MPELVLVESAGVGVGLRLNRADSPDRVILLNAQGRLEFALPAPIPIPSELIADGPDVTKRLLTLDEMRVRAVSDGAKIEEAWQALLTKLSRIEVLAARAASGAALIGGVAVTPSTTTSVQASVTTNLREVVLNGAAPEAELRLDAACTVTLAGTRLDTSLAVFLRVGVAAPRLSFALAEFPLRFPELELPAFDWATLTSVAWTPIELPALAFLPVGVAANDVTFNGAASEGALGFKFIIGSVDVGLRGRPRKTWFKNVTIELAASQLSIDFQTVPVALDLSGFSARLLQADGPLTMSLGAGSALNLGLRVSGGKSVALGWLVADLTIASVADASRSLSVRATLPFEADRIVDRTDDGAGKVVQRSVELEVSPGTFEALELATGEIAGEWILSLRFPAKWLEAIGTLVHLLAQLLGQVGRALSGLAQQVHRVIEGLAEQVLRGLDALDATLVLDKRTGALRQVVFNIHRAAGQGPFEWEKFGFQIRGPADADLALVLDFRDGRRDACFVVTAETAPNAPLLEIGTDLWFSTPDTERPAGELGAKGDSPEQHPRLLAVKVTPTDPAATRISLVPFGLRDGRATFLQAWTPALPKLGAGVSIDPAGHDLVDLPNLLKTRVLVDPKAAGKRLPFLGAPDDGTDGSGGADALKQSVVIKAPTGDGYDVVAGVARVPIEAEIHALGKTFATTLDLEVELRTLSARVSGGRVDISVSESFELFGMAGRFEKDGLPLAEKQFVLDLNGSDPRLSLKEDVELFLDFGLVSSTPLTFKVSGFAMHGGGLDLDAALASEARIPLNGLDTDFTFKAARLCVRDSRPTVFTLDAKGKLPPALLGDVDSDLHLSFGMKGGRFTLLDGSLELMNKGKPIRSEQTHFVFTLDGVAVRVFEDGGSLHFCAFVSGSAEFKPEAAELADGMFKKLAGVTLSFTDCPVCGASEVIQRELEKLNLSFIVALDEPARTKVFEFFELEVRSIGLEPRCRQFDDAPAALVLGGQITFAAKGDVVRAECDFHRIYIAPPAKDGYLPRIRCEGLGVAIRLGSAFSIEGQVTAVDGTMQNVLLSEGPTDRLKGKGFMGQGRVAIEGLPPLAASFGFVEVRRGDWSGRAWFVYLEAQHLSYHFQLGPVPIYLREVGLGLGYHFTYVGIADIDRAPDLPAIIDKLDKIASTALEPAKVETWAADPEPGLTLVARAMLSMSSASAPQEPLVWKPEEEKELPNVLLLNVLMAMRNSTFMMTANAWLGWNYHDWDEKRRLGQNELVGRQALTGYVVVVGSRSEFLARLKGNRGAEVGPRLALPDTFKSALKEVEYDATVYFRPGLMHFEVGWPDRIRWSKDIAGVHLSVAGGAIFRVHDESLLVGLNLEGRLAFAMSGSLDAGVVGISVSASVEAALAARIIGYLDAKKTSDSLYYSLFSLQVRIAFAVSAWLEIDAWLCKITIKASFSISLQVDVLAELAIRGDGTPGTRMRATIAISIFGRSLGLSIGLAMNTRAVDDAQARVARFMQLGLVQEVPSVSPPLQQQDARVQEAAEVGQERRDAQATAGLANASHPDGLAPVPHEEEVVAIAPKKEATQGHPIGATDFQIVASYPLVMEEKPDRKPADWVYLTFLPIDAKGDTKSSFYAAPEALVSSPKEADHRVDFSKLGLQPGETLEHWNGTAWVEVEAKDLADFPTYVDWTRTLAYEESTRENPGTPSIDRDYATLKQLFFAAFRTSKETPDHYLEPLPRALRRLTDPRAEARPDLERDHLAQQRAYAAAIGVDPADRRCHEARDFLMYKFISDLFAYAAEGTRSQAVHVLDLRLTFRVKKAVIERLDEAQLRELAIVKKRVVDNGAIRHEPSAACRLFNPPARTFERNPPDFDARYSESAGGRVKLDWTLKWALDDEPAEHYLQYHEVRRSIEIGTDTFESDPMRVIRADREHLKHDAAKNRLVRSIERAPWQFTDEFEDLDADQRKRLQESGGTATIRYDITPVCVSNTRGRTCSSFVLRHGGWPALKAPTKARATLIIDPAADEADEARRLGIEFEMTLETQPPPRGQRRWEILLRPEPIVPAGQYGADAEVQRSLGGWLASSGLARPDDQAYTQAIADDAAGELAFQIDAAIAGSIRKAFLDRDDDPRAWRIRARQIVVDTLRPDDVLTASTWTEVELAVLLRRRERARGQVEYVSLKPPSFEYIRQARGIEADMLAPLPFEALAPVDSGRATRVVPDDGTLRTTPRSTLHPDFDAASRLSWNVVPPGTDGAALVPWRLLAGFDVARLDLDGAAQIEPGDWRRARRITAARLLEADKLRLVPDEVGDAANWKAAYHSLAARRRAGGAWYSEAESYIEWPRPGHRLEAIPEPSSDLLAGLLSHGVPDAIVIGIAWEPPSKPLNQDSEVPDKQPDLLWTLASTSPQASDPWKLRQASRLEFVGRPEKAADSLRDALRRLEIRATHRDPAGAAEDRIPVRELRRWQLTLSAVVAVVVEGNDQDREIATQTLPLNLDRCLHPLLESILARMRRYRRPGDKEVALLDLDRRPPPALKATTAAEFFGATQQDADPFGWVALDRLGLGVTLRLFDPLHDTFVDRATLKRQFEAAVDGLRADGVHLHALDHHLCVDWLLQPGQLLRPVAFDERPDALGFVGTALDDAWLDDASLSMMRISVRPRIVKRHAYQVDRYAVADARKLGSGRFDAMLLEDGVAAIGADKAVLETLLRQAAARAAGPDASKAALAAQETIERVVLIRYTNTLEGVTGNDGAPGRTEGDLADAFGRFPALPWADGDDGHLVQAQLGRYWHLLWDVTPQDAKKGLAAPPVTPDFLSVPAWLAYNGRFFEHASGHPDRADVTCSYAATEATEPVAVAPDAHGRVSVFLPEADGYAHQFALAVTPQWRYRDILASADYGVEAVEKPVDPLAIPPLVIATVERTAPVLPPVLISLGIVGDRTWWRRGQDWLSTRRGETAPDGAVRVGSDAGVSAALLLPHHPERRLARANVPAQRNLAHAGELYTQLSLPVDAPWCESFVGKPLPPLPALPRIEIADDAISTIDEIAASTPAESTLDRSRIRLVSYLPHWYRSIAAIAAASGTEASAPAVTYLPESAARLVLTDRDPDRKGSPLSLVAGHPWHGHTTVDGPPAKEDVVQVETLGAVPHGGLRLEIPLLRYRDTTDADTARLWPDAISTVPDPGVAYQIDLVAPPRRGEPRASLTPLARIVRSEPGGGKAAFRVMPISRDWRIECKLKVDSGVNGIDRALDVTLSPLGAPLGGAALTGIEIEGTERDAAGALRAPGGWSIGWIAPLLEPLTGEDPDALSRVVGVFRAIAEQGIGLPVDATGFLDVLASVRVMRLRLRRPTTETEWKMLTVALDEWQSKNFGHGKTIAAHVRRKFLDATGAPQWPFGTDAVELEIPWLGDMVKPEPGLIPLEGSTDARVLLPELMSPEMYALLIVGADATRKARADALWQAQKDAAVGARRIVVTACRGDAIPLQRLPIRLA